ncbi:MAG TPA: YjbQ family protein [Actinomycetota bacterium]|jgi:secondary thiamine-phosphate synthase enzyme|nr:YjbQ family protein [Actinomycetota bacterium]
MRTHQEDCQTQTRAALDFVDITDQVQSALDGCGLGRGQMTVFTESPSCALLVNERETGLLEDIRVTLERLETATARDRKALLGSSSVVLPVVDGRLHLGSWQRVLLVELDEPGMRKVTLQMVGE